MLQKIYHVDLFKRVKRYVAEKITTLIYSNASSDTRQKKLSRLFI